MLPAFGRSASLSLAAAIGLTTVVAVLASAEETPKAIPAAAASR